MAGQIGTITVGAKLAGGTQQAFKAIADGMRTMAKAMSALAKDTKSLGSSAQSKAFGSMAKEMNNWAAQLEKVSSGSIDAAVKIKDLAAGQAELSQATGKTASELAKESQELAKADKSMTKHEAEVVALSLQYNELFLSSSKYGNKARDLAVQFLTTSGNIRVFRQEIAQQGKEFAASAGVQAQFSKKLADTDNMYRKLLTTQDTFGTKARKLRDSFVRLGGDAREYGAQLKKLQQDQKAFNTAWQGAERLKLQFDLLLQSTDKNAKKANELVKAVRNQEMSFADARIELQKYNREWLKSEKGKEAARELRDQLNKLKLDFKDLIRTQSQYQQRAKNLFRYFNEGKISAKQLSDQLGVLAKRQREAAKAQREAEAAAKKAAFQSRKLATTYDKLVNSSSRYGTAARKIIQNLKEQKIAADRAELGLKRLNQQMLGTATPLTQAFNRLGRSFRTYMSYVAASTTIFAFINATREATRTVIEYDQALKDLQAITRATQGEVEAMGAKIKQVASDTKFSATEIADGMKLLGQSGLTAAETIETIDAVSTLATGTLTDLSTTVDLVTTAMRVFGIEAQDSARIADVFANAVNRSKLTIDKIRTAMNYIGPVAAAAGASIEETASAMMVLANHGIRASTIGTGLRQVFRRLVQPAESMKLSMQQAVMTIDDFDIRAQGLAKVVENLGVTVTDTQEAFRMFGQRGATAALALIEGGSEAIVKMMDIVHRSGAAAEMAAIQMEGLGVSLKNLDDKIKNLYIAMGESGLHGALRAFVDIARVLTDFLTGVFSNTITQTISQFTILTAGTFALGRALKYLIGLVFGKNFFAALSSGAKTYTASAGTATAATRLLSGAVVTLRGILATFWPAALITGALWFISWLTNANQRLDDYHSKLQRTQHEQQRHVDALNAAIDVLSSENFEQQEKVKVIDKLLQMYPHLSQQIINNKDDIESVIPTLEKEVELRQHLQDLAFFKEAQSRGKTLSKDLEELANLEEIISRGEYKDRNLFQKMMISDSEIEQRFVELRDKTAKELKGYVEFLNTKLFDRSDADVASWVKTYMSGQSDAAVQAVTDMIMSMRKAADTGLAEYAKELNKDIAEVREMLLQGGTAEDVKEDYKTRQAELERQLELEKLAISRAAANNVEIKQQEKELLQAAEIKASEAKIELAKETQMKLKVRGDIEGEVKLLVDKEKAYEAHYKKLGGYLSKHSDDVTKYNGQIEEKNRTHQQKITDHEQKTAQIQDSLGEKRAEHKQAMADKIEDLERDLAQKIEDINKSLNDKLKDLTQKRVETEKKAQADILGIRQSFEEKLLSLEQRGMSDSEIELSNESFAREQYSKAQAALSAAIRGGDIDGIEQAVELFEKAGDYFGDLSDTSKARSGIMSVRDALIAARQEEEKIAQAKINQEEKDARAGAQTKREKAKREMQDQLTDFTQAEDKKLAKALETIQQQEQAEQRRWDKELANYDAAIAKIEEKKQAALSAQQEINQYMDQSAFNKDVSKTGKELGLGGESGVTPAISQEGKKGLVKVHQEAAAEGISKGVKDKQVATSIEEISGTGLGEKIAEDVGAGVQQGLSQIEQYTQVGDQSLEEWRKSGEKQGEAAGEAAGEKIGEEIDKAVIEYNEQGEPVGLRMEAAAEDVDTMIDGIQDTLADSPFELAIDEREFARQMEILVRDAQNKYKITIPVTVRQANAEGGPVYKMASGGRLPGQSGPHDTLDVKARPGEWFIRNEAVAEWQRRIGNWFMPGVNRPNSMPGKYLQSLLVHGNQQNSVPEIPNLGKMTINLGGRSAEIMGTPVNLKNFVNMMKDAEAFSS